MIKKGEKMMSEKEVETYESCFKKVVTKVWCGYSPEKQELLSKYISPKTEHSYFKGIPMSLYSEITRLLPSKHRRIAYWAKGETCRKELAEAFSVYYSVRFLLSLGRPGCGMVSGYSAGLRSICEKKGVHIW